MGLPINTLENDAFFVLSGDGKHAYYSSIRIEGAGEKDLYQIIFSGKGVRLIPHLTIFKGKVTDSETSEPVESIIHVVDNDWNDDDKTHSSYYGSYKFISKKDREPEGIKVNLVDEKDEVIKSTTTDDEGYFQFQNLPNDQRYAVRTDIEDDNLDLLFFENTDNIVGEYKSNSENGEFLIPLQAGKNYAIVFYSPGHIFHSENVNTPDTASFEDVTVNVKFKKFEKRQPHCFKESIFLAAGRILWSLAQ